MEIVFIGECEVFVCLILIFFFFFFFFFFSPWPLGVNSLKTNTYPLNKYKSPVSKLHGWSSGTANLPLK